MCIRDRSRPGQLWQSFRWWDMLLRSTPLHWCWQIRVALEKNGWYWKAQIICQSNAADPTHLGPGRWIFIKGEGGVVCVHFYLTQVWSLSTLVTHLLADTNYFEADVSLSLCGWCLALNPSVCCVFGNVFLEWTGWRCQYNVDWNCGHTETITAILVVPSHVFSAQSWLESHEVFLLRIPFLQRNLVMA